MWRGKILYHVENDASVFLPLSHRPACAPLLILARDLDLSQAIPLSIPRFTDSTVFYRIMTSETAKNPKSVPKMLVVALEAMNCTYTKLPTEDQADGSMDDWAKEVVKQMVCTSGLSHCLMSLSRFYLEQCGTVR